MWGPLKHPRHVDLYVECHSGRQNDLEDWMPMVRAVRYLQSLSAAPRLYAFNSMWRFHVTTAPIFQECDKHCSVSIIWRCSERRFHIAFGRLSEGWLDDRPNPHICEESSFPAITGPFVERLLSIDH
jgi:hypothetical protein